MDLQNKRIAIIATDYFEEAELVQPMEALQAAGAIVDVIAPHDGAIKGLNHVDPGREVPVTKTFDQADAADYDGLIVPGGAVNSDNLRVDKDAQNFLISIMAEQEKPTAIICHGPWLLASTGLARGRTLTSFYTIQDDLLNAGAEWVDQEVVQDGNLITSRNPDDLPAFIEAFKTAVGGAEAA